MTLGDQRLEIAISCYQIDRIKIILKDVHKDID